MNVWAQCGLFVACGSCSSPRSHSQPSTNSDHKFNFLGWQWFLIREKKTRTLIVLYNVLHMNLSVTSSVLLNRNEILRKWRAAAPKMRITKTAFNGPFSTTIIPFNSNTKSDLPTKIGWKNIIINSSAPGMIYPRGHRRCQICIAYYTVGGRPIKSKPMSHALPISFRPFAFEGR